jgi:nitronate monooxygenase
LRAWRNGAALKVAEIEAEQGDMWRILPLVAGTETVRMIEEGDVDAGVLPCSQSIGVVDELKSVAAVIGDMVCQAEEIGAGLAGLPRRATPSG